MERRRDMFQPSPGWGSLCERCDNRQKGSLEKSNFPCIEVIHRPSDRSAPRDWPRDENGHPINIVGPDLVRYRDQREECSSSKPRESAPANSKTVLYEATR